MSLRHYQEMKVWQEAMRLAHLAYDCTNLFPSIERYVLLPQVRRAAIRSLRSLWRWPIT